jgi:hypothetical protein
MAYENDPNRMIDPDRPGPRFQYQSGDGFGWIPVILAVAAVALLIMLLLPARNETGPRVTENSARTEQPTKPTVPSAPPASKPTPTAPAPTPPQ